MVTKVDMFKIFMSYGSYQKELYGLLELYCEKQYLELLSLAAIVLMGTMSNLRQYFDQSMWVIKCMGIFLNVIFQSSILFK